MPRVRSPSFKIILVVKRETFLPPTLAPTVKKEKKDNNNTFFKAYSIEIFPTPNFYSFNKFNGRT